MVVSALTAGPAAVKAPGLGSEGHALCYNYGRIQYNMVCYSITYVIIRVKYRIIEYVIVQYGMSWKESLCGIFVQFVEGLVFRLFVS